MNKVNVLIILLFILLTCCSGNKLTDSAPDSVDKLILQTENTRSLEGDFFAFNTANFFTFFNSDDTTIRNKTGLLNPELLRFPGGTIANFYHPSGKGYGFRKHEIKTREGGIDTNLSNLMAEQEALKDTTNFLNRFIPFARNLNVKVIYVANVLTADISETVETVRLLRSAGLKVQFIELGNEFYLNAYSDMVPDAASYVKKAKPLADALHHHFPEIKLSVPSEAKFHKVSNKPSYWDLTLSKFNFYDAVSVHLYPDFNNCKTEKNILNFNCYSNAISQLLFQKYADFLNRTTRLYQNKPLLITEWNIARPNRSFGNTMLHGIYTALFQLENMQLNSLNKIVQLMCFHNLASKENAYSLLTPDNISQSFPPSINYAVFKILSPLANSHPVYVPLLPYEKSNQAKIYAFRTAGKYHVYVVNYGSSGFRTKGFVNEKGNDAEIFTAECLYGSAKNGSAVSPENFNYKANADPLNFPPFSITHVTLKF